MRRLIGRVLCGDVRRFGLTSFTIESRDGTKIDVAHLPAAEPNGRLPVLFMHGWLEVKEYHVRRAMQMTALGHDVVLFDHRAHGRSEGRETTFGVREKEDASAVVDEVIRRELIGERIIAMGHSLGGATALQQAAADPRVTGVVAFAPFGTLRDAIDSFRDQLAPWMSSPWLMRGFERAAFEAGFDLDHACTITAAQKLTVPVMLIDAGRDRSLPTALHATRIVESMTTAKFVRFTVPEASHVNLVRNNWPGLSEAVDRFCAELR